MTDVPRWRQRAGLSGCECGAAEVVPDDGACSGLSWRIRADRRVKRATPQTLDQTRLPAAVGVQPHSFDVASTSNSPRPPSS
jgi:hypothetical protein